ncbi:hypothetical protein Tco_1472579, partial [Tanacetum coccineum]
ICISCFHSTLIITRAAMEQGEIGVVAARKKIAKEKVDRIQELEQLKAYQIREKAKENQVVVDDNRVKAPGMELRNKFKVLSLVLGDER